MKSAPTIVLELRPSAALRAGLVLAAGLALLAVALTGVAWPTRILLAVLILGLALRAEARLRAIAGTRLVLAPAGAWQLETPAGGEPALELAHSAEVGSLVALTLGRGKAARRMVLLPDSCDREDLRRLRVWLRHGNSEAARPAAIQ